jgi:predicted Zn finger-like uncharacterized protein
MIIACPSCRTRYRVDPASLGRAGRTVRCSGCGERWFIESPAVAVDLPPLPSAEPPVEPTPKRSGSAAVRMAVGLGGLALAGLLLGRNEVVAWYPAAATAYQRLGLPVELSLGVEFRRLGSSRRQEDGGNVLVVTGEIANVSGQHRAVPPIRVGLIDGQGREIDHALFDPPRPALEPEAAHPFEVKLAAPPPEARDFSISFADRPP